MSPFCQIEYVSSDSDKGVPCDKTAVAKCTDCGSAICDNCSTECCRAARIEAAIRSTRLRDSATKGSLGEPFVVTLTPYAHMPDNVQTLEPRRSRNLRNSRWEKDFSAS